MQVNMKKIYCLIFSLASFFQLSAVETLLEAKGACFYPTNHTIRKIYGVGGEYGLEGSVSFSRNFYAWASGDVLYQHGHSLGSDQSTYLTLVPIAAGIKYLYPLHCKVDFYAGAGPQYSYMNISNHSNYVTRHIRKWGWGGIGKAGFLFDMYQGIFLDVFAQYSYLRIPFHNSLNGQVTPNNIHLSGWQFGGAIGYRFGSSDCRE
jgi:hypothetical protein